MVTVVKENPANAQIKYGTYVLGEIKNVPDELYHPELYSHDKATKEFRVLSQDVYERTQKHERADRKKTPVSVLCILGLVALFALCKGVKHLIKK